jgi:DNA-binding XRE family transcriptional regulator
MIANWRRRNESPADPDSARANIRRHVKRLVRKYGYPPDSKDAAVQKCPTASRGRLRHAKGLSQDDLAFEAEVSRNYLSQLEKGAFYASLKIVGKLAAVLDVEPAELLKLPSKRSARGK